MYEMVREKPRPLTGGRPAGGRGRGGGSGGGGDQDVGLHVGLYSISTPLTYDIHNGAWRR